MKHDRELDHFSDQARDECEVCSLRAERDRLQVVVDAASDVLMAIDSTVPGRLFARIEGRDVVTRLRAALDRSGTVGGEGTDARPDDGVDGPIGGVVGRPARAENERRAGGAGPRDRAGAGARREVRDADKWSFEWPSRESPTEGAGDE